MSDFPYPGLRPFRRDESDIFFGREGDITRLTKRLANYHFIAVVGNSGSGKSSLIQAGLLARLNLGVIHGRHWRTAKMRPGNHPFRNLSIALLRDTKKAEELALREDYLHFNQIKPEEDAVSKLESDLIGALKTSYQILEKILPDNHNLLIVVDQFEELFRYSSVRTKADKAEVRDFIQWLLTSKDSRRIYVVITLRLEFEDECSRYAGLKQAIENGRFHISYLTNEQLEESIKFPAQVCHGEVKPQVVERLLADLEEIDETTHYADRLPLLQYTLARMWLKAGSAKQKVLKLQHYEEIGGNLAAALNNHIQQVYLDLSDSDKKITETLFRCLSQKNEENNYIRHPIKLKEVAILANVLWQAVSTLVDHFRREGNKFLFSPDKLPTSYFQAEDVIDITHESIIRQWKQLKKWADEEAQWARSYQRWEESAELWKDKKGELWRGLDLKSKLEWVEEVQRLYPTLEQLKAWSNRYGKNFELAWQFLEASKQQQKQFEEKQRQKQEKQKLAEQQEKQKLAEQFNLRRRKKNTVLIVFIVISIFAVWGFREIQFAQQLEQSRIESLFGSYRQHAASLAQLGNYREAQQILEKTYEFDPKISDSPRRHARNLLASFINLMSGQGQKYSSITNQRGIVVAFALSPDKSKLALVRTEKRKISKVELFEAKTNGKLLKSFDMDHKRRSEVKTVVFHPQGEWLATADDNGEIILWSLDGKPIKNWSTDTEVRALAINTAGNLLASGSLASGGEDNIITVWNLATNQQQLSLSGHQSAITDLAFSPNGEFLASASEDKTARLWRVSDGKVLYQLRAHTDKVQQVAFSPDGKLLATGSDDGTIHLWKVDTGESMALLSGHRNKISGIAFIADGRYLASASADSTLRLWDVASGVTLRILQGDTKEHFTDITTDGQSVFSSSRWNGIKRWDTTLPYQYAMDLPTPPTAIAIAPNAQQIAIGFKDGLVQGYSLPPNSKLIWQQENIHTNDIKQLDFSTDGRFLASTSSDEIAKVWQIQTDKLTQIGIINHKYGRVNAIAFSPDNKILLSAGDDGQIGLFKLDSQEEPQFYSPDKGKGIKSVMWDASGDYVLTASYHTAYLWQTRDLLAIYTLPRIEAISAALSPDAKRIAVVGRRRGYFDIKIYPDRSQTPYQLFGHQDTVIRALFSPDSQQLASLGKDNTVRFWDLLQQSELFTINLPTKGKDVVRDFDFRCLQNHCWVAVPLSQDKKLLLYELSTGQNL